MNTTKMQAVEAKALTDLDPEAPTSITVSPTGAVLVVSQRIELS